MAYYRGKSDIIGANTGKILFADSVHTDRGEVKALGSAPPTRSFSAKMSAPRAPSRLCLVGAVLAPEYARDRALGSGAKPRHALSASL